MVVYIDTETIFQEQALLLKALADPTRLKIITMLIEADGTLDVTGLVDYLDRLTQATVSHHLLLLANAGLIECHKEKLHAFYRVKPARLEEAQAIIALLLQRKGHIEG